MKKFFLNGYINCMRIRDEFPIGVVGASHRLASLWVREKIARAAEEIEKERFFFQFPLLLLSTCNRTEIYFNSADLQETGRALFGFFRSKGLEDPKLFYSRFGIDCFSHLCRVTSGLDSAVVGETEIQHQVKLAYVKAASRLQLSKALHYAFQKALRIGKQTREQFAPFSPTFNEILWKIAERHPAPLSCVLLVGYSEINRRFAKFLQKKRDVSITLATSHPESSSKIEGVEIVSRSILKRWQEFDWIIFATRSSCYLIDGEGSGHNLLFDLSVPRTVPPTTTGVSLWNVEQIAQQMEIERELRPAPQPCIFFVEESARRYAALYQTREKSWRLKTQRDWENGEKGSH
ncbi:MAG: hypothetical protein HY324_00110, partial [Chlamydiia bacterium]|nr:hypothetical protein [Chlamydiia bacterium]